MAGKKREETRYCPQLKSDITPDMDRPPTLNFNEIDRRYICNFIDIYFELEHFQLAFQFNMRGPGNLRINDK